MHLDDQECNQECNQLRLGPCGLCVWGGACVLQWEVGGGWGQQDMILWQLGLSSMFLGQEGVRHPYRKGSSS